MTQTIYENALAREFTCNKELTRCNVLLETTQRNDMEITSQLNVTKAREKETNSALKQISLELVQSKFLLETFRQQNSQLVAREQNQTKEYNDLTLRENELKVQLKISKEAEDRANSELKQALVRETEIKLQLENSKTLLQVSKQGEEIVNSELKQALARETEIKLQLEHSKGMLQASKQGEERVNSELKQALARETEMKIQLENSKTLLQREIQLNAQINNKLLALDEVHNISKSLKQLSTDNVSEHIYYCCFYI
jgi:hypothetical protein